MRPVEARRLLRAPLRRVTALDEPAPTIDVDDFRQRGVDRRGERRRAEHGSDRIRFLAIYGKRGVGKSSLLRQVQQMALGDYTLAKKAGLTHERGEVCTNSSIQYFVFMYRCEKFNNDISLEYYAPSNRRANSDFISRRPSVIT